MNCIDFAGKIDYTYLKLDLTSDKLLSLVKDVLNHKFRSLVVPYYAITWLDESIVHKLSLCTVISFPFGTAPTRLKVEEAIAALDMGYDEVDIVSNIWLIKSGLYDQYREEVKQIVSEIRDRYPDKTIKIIGEVTILNYNELRKAIDAINSAKPDFFKTSTGYGPRGTILDDVIQIRQVLNPEIRIKASGGIRSYRQAMDLISAGADVIGTSSAMQIIKECIKLEGCYSGRI
ncbi:TPA: deoxyribose-phosphate aldolase [Candidatus Geothermarchaeota archaeon]|nr:deoxyribose-phosphate aldolase [Candidatus Geothermarchaeota archaeon]